MSKSYRLTIEFTVDDDVTNDEVAEFTSAALVQVSEAVVLEDDGNERSIETFIDRYGFEMTHRSKP